MSIVFVSTETETNSARKSDVWNISRHFLVRNGGGKTIALSLSGIKSDTSQRHHNAGGDGRNSAAVTEAANDCSHITNLRGL